MNESESRFHRLLNQLTAWWASAGRRPLRRPEGTESIRRGAAERAQQARTALGDLRGSDTGRKAASALHDLRGSEAGKRAASALHDLRGSEAGKRAASALHDLRGSEAGKRAASALQDFRGREPVRKAEDSARRVIQDMRHGPSSGPSKP
jgi:hypothetical protein